MLLRSRHKTGCELILTCKRGGKVEELCPEVGYLRQGWLYVLLEVLHGHGGEVEELVSHFVRPLKARGLTDVPQDALNLVKDLKNQRFAHSIVRFLDDTFARFL